MATTLTLMHTRTSSSWPERQGHWRWVRVCLACIQSLAQQHADRPSARSPLLKPGTLAVLNHHQAWHTSLTHISAACMYAGLVKSLMGKQREDGQHQQSLLSLCAAALDMLDTVRSALTTKGLELEVQRYNLIRRMTLAGYTDMALQQGLMLHAALEAHASDLSAKNSSSSSASSLQELCQACRLNLVVSTGEALTAAASAEDAQHMLQQVMPALSALLEQLRCVCVCACCGGLEVLMRLIPG